MKIESKKKIISPMVMKITLLLSVVGPGLVTANLDNDAGGIATYSLAGAQTGYRLMWVLIPVTIALIMFQEMSARMGIVSGKGLADLIREKFGLRITFYSLFFYYSLMLETQWQNLRESHLLVKFLERQDT